MVEVRAPGAGTAGPPELSPGLVERIVELAPDGILVVDQEGRVHFANRQAEAIFGFDPGTLAGSVVEELVPERLVDAHAAHRDRYAESPAARPMGIGFDLWGRRRDGSEVPVEISLSPVSVDGGLRTIVVVREVTEHRASEASARLRMLVEDQQRIATDLHHRVIERLFRSAMLLQSVMRLAGGGTRERLAEAVAELDQAIHEIRNAVFDHYAREPRRGDS